MGADDPTGHGQFRPQGLNWQDLCRGPLNIATDLINRLWASWFQRRRFFRLFFFFIISLWDLMAPGVWPIWIPGAQLAGFM